MNKLLLILGGGAALWWLNRQQTATPVATTGAQTATQTAATQTGGTQTTGTQTTGTQTGGTQTGGTQTGGTQTGGTQTTPALTFSQIVGKLAEAMRSDPAVYDGQNINATFSQFNWYLARVSGQQDLPDYWTATGGQTDPNTPISIARYIEIIGPWLKTNRGLSGARLWTGYVGPGGWIA